MSTAEYYYKEINMSEVEPEDPLIESIKIKKDDVAIVIGNDLELTMHLPTLDEQELIPSNVTLGMAFTIRAGNDAQWVNELMDWFIHLSDELDKKTNDALLHKSNEENQLSVESTEQQPIVVLPSDF